ncbi:MAG: SH3 domain-containing protein [Octadecabacter sp.]|nr:SH3 domain-containing protein [Octadecabacter sp.]
MKSYVWLTFAFMGWGYYEMSGGADFVPVERVTAAVEVEEPEIVARADTATLLSVSSSNIIAQPETTAAEVEAAVANAVALDTVDVVAPIVEPELDIRQVGSSRVNMRMGPSTNFEVITTLNSGTKLEILSVNEDGWANVSTVDRGIEGWMAERLLTDSDL